MSRMVVISTWDLPESVLDLPDGAVSEMLGLDPADTLVIIRKEGLRPGTPEKGVNTADSCRTDGAVPVPHKSAALNDYIPDPGRWGIGCDE
jgi:hypothetical protein